MADKKQARQAKDVQAQSKVEQILINDMEISAKADALLAETRQMNSSIVNALDSLSRQTRASERAGAQGEAVYAAINEEIKALKRELRYMAIQSASIFEGVTEKINELKAALDGIDTSKLAEKSSEAKAAAPQIDYDLLADKVAERTAAKTPVATSASAEPIDYDLLADKVAERTADKTPSYPSTYPVTYKSEANIDYDALVEKIVSRMPAPKVVADGKTTVVAAPAPAPEIDYDALARKVAAVIPAASRSGNSAVNTDEMVERIVARIPVPETISPDYIASKVAEQIVVPKSGGSDLDYNKLASAVASRIVIPEAKSDGGYVPRPVHVSNYDDGVDNEAIAKKVAEYLVKSPAADGTETYAEGEAQKVNININLSGLDNEYIADRVIENFVVPDYQEIMFDYDYLAAKIAEKTGIQSEQPAQPAPAPAPAPAAVAPAPVPVDYNINEGELADAIALRVGSLKAEDF
ncbi:MAG: hypothetical protein K2K80_04280 [Clostridia bacterium]|nr:hypothetical protein [Clostridia bacterium]